MIGNMTSCGKNRRLKRIFAQDGKALMVAVNHGLGYGPVPGIENMAALLKRLMPFKPNSITLHKGLAVRFAELIPGETSVILKLTNQTRHFAPEETDISTVNEAVCLDADAVAVGLSLCGPHEREEISRASGIVAEAEKCGMPTVAHAYPCGSFLKDTERYEVKHVAYATRVALELGIDIIKTYWTGDTDSFATIVKAGAPAKVVISGGPKCPTLLSCFKMTYEGMDAGAAGVTYGRNIWQHPWPDAVMAGLNAIIHGEETPARALEIARDITHQKLE